MGGCASKPKDLDTEEAPVPVENPEKAEEKTEIKIEEPLVDLSEPAADEESKPETAEAASDEAKPAELAEANPEDAAEKAEEPEKEEEKKDEAETEAAAPKPENN